MVRIGMKLCCCFFSSENFAAPLPIFKFVVVAHVASLFGVSFSPSPLLVAIALIGAGWIGYCSNLVDFLSVELLLLFSLR